MKRFLFVVLLGVTGALFAQEKTYDPFTLRKEDVKERLDKMPATHPRLFVKRPDTLSVISTNIDKRPEWRMIRDWIVSEADSYLKTEPTKRKKQGFRMQGQHDVLKRVVALSSAYWFTEDMKYVERAKKEMLAASDFTDWNPAHFLDTAEMTLGMAVGYDWLFHVLDEQSKATIRNAIIEKGLKQSLVKKYFWTKGNNNWSQVCWGGMTAGALAIRDEEPELALEVLHKAITGVPYSVKVYAPNGCYPEGPAYWTYGTGYFVYMMDMLEKSLGSNFGLYDLPGFSKTGEFFNLATGTSGSFYNYADGGKNRVHNLSMWWLANRANRDDWLVKEHQDVLAAIKSGKPESSALKKVRLRILLLLWMKDVDDNVEIKMPLCWSSGGHVPIVVMRSSWNDPNAAFLATKGGPASQNHGHMDSGSFVYDVDGIRWAVDLGSQGYYSIEKLGMSLWSSAQNSDRWKIFRLNSRSHNLVTIDDQLHYAKGHGKILAYNDSSSPSTVVDLGDVYKGQLSSYKRSFALLPDRSANISDDIKGVTPGAKVRWAMVTAAKEITKDGNSLVLKQSGKTLRVEPQAPVDVSWKIEDLAEPPNEWDSSNKGHSMISFTAIASQSGRINFKVALKPQSVE